MTKPVKRNDSAAYAALMDERLERYLPSQADPAFPSKSAAPAAKKAAGFNQAVLSRLIERIKTI